MRFLSITLLILSSICSSKGQGVEEITTVILVRHAEKINDGTRDPALSKAGIQRSLKLADLFKNAEINAIYSTEFRRTRQTVTPLAELLKLNIQSYDPSGQDFIQRIYRQNLGKTILISGHSNTTPQAVNSLIGKEKYQLIDHDEYGRIFFITLDSGQKKKIVELYY